MVNKGVVQSLFGLASLLLSYYCSVSVAAAVANELNVASFTTRNKGLQRVMVHRTTGDVYVGATNRIYHLNSQLRLKLEHVSGPLTDNIRCPPESDSCHYYRGQVDNHNRVLVLDYDLGYLVSCGTGFQGTCELHNPGSISPSLSRAYRGDYLRDFVATDGSVVSFFAPASPDGSLALYVGASRNSERPASFLVHKAVSSKRLAYIFGQWGWKFAFDLETPATGTFIDVKEEAKEYSIDYVHGFTSGNHSYFVTVQRAEPKPKSPYLTKLVRLCNNDPGYYSYTEIKLQCGDHLGLLDYNVAQAAFVGKAGVNLAAGLGLSTEEDVLFVVFSWSLSDSKEPGDDSALCFYPISRLDQAIKRGLQACFFDGQGSQGLRHFTQDRPCNQAKERVVDDDFCGTPDFYPVGVSDAVVETDYMHYGGHGDVFTSLVVTHYNGGSETIAIMGNKEGHVKKVLLDPGNSDARTPYADYALSRQPIMQSMSLDLPKENVYVVTENKLYRMPVHSCRVHSECSTCVTSRDPLQCGWCGTFCGTATECRRTSQPNATWTRDVCRPVVYSVNPLSSPIEGGTEVEILGDSLGTPANGSHIVKLSGVPCRPQPEKCSLHKLTCVTVGPGEVIPSGAIEVQINLRTKTYPFKIDGRTIAEQKFTFQDPEIDNFLPRYGPAAGGTKLMVTGSYLTTGRIRNITVGHSSCQIGRQTDSDIWCTTSTSYTVGSQPVTVWFDGKRRKVPSQIQYNYTQNPQVKSLQPSRSFVSGGLAITVRGSNLHTVKTPAIILSVNVSSDKIENFQEVCQSSTDGWMMTCSSPNLSKLPVSEEGLLATASFAMDNVVDLRNLGDLGWNRVVYYPDPVFYRFVEPNHVRTLENTGQLLYLYGTKLDLSASAQDIRILIGGEFCRIVELKNDTCTCRPPQYNSSIPGIVESQVMVQVGRLEFRVGYVRYASEQPKQYLVPAIVGGCVSLLIVIVILIACYFTRKRMKHRYQMTEREDAMYKLKVERSSPSKQPPHLSDDYVDSDSTGGRTDTPISVAWMSRLNKDLVLAISDSLIDRRKLTLEKVVGKGHFGLVYHGKLTTHRGDVQVAIKTLRERTDMDQIKAFLREGIMMKDFHHPNILRLVGVCLTQDEAPLVILPFMRHGNLLAYIRDTAREPTVKDLVKFALQIAEGMQYLSSLKFVHRDLAARNCMLGDRQVVKIGDFGLSRDIYERDYYSTMYMGNKLPVRWMSLESLERSVYNTKTDVWSFGIVLWELLTRGVTPYPSVDNWDITNYLSSGKRLPQPHFCSDKMYKVMLRCWATNPQERPGFSELVYKIGTFLNDREENYYLDMAAVYTNMPIPSQDNNLFNTTAV